MIPILVQAGFLAPVLAGIRDCSSCNHFIGLVLLNAALFVAFVSKRPVIPGEFLSVFFGPFIMTFPGGRLGRMSPDGTLVRVNFCDQAVTK
jgi:hypothetical protein